MSSLLVANELLLFLCFLGKEPLLPGEAIRLSWGWADSFGVGIRGLSVSLEREDVLVDGDEEEVMEVRWDVVELMDEGWFSKEEEAFLGEVTDFLEVERLRGTALAPVVIEDFLEVERLSVEELVPLMMEDFLELERLREVISVLLTIEDLLEVEQLRGAPPALLVMEDLLEVERLRGVAPELLAIDDLLEVV